MKKKDLLLAGGILLFAALWIGFRSLVFDAEDAFVVVTVAGETYGTYSLQEDRTIDIGGTNTLVIRDKEADMTGADCPDQICVHQKAISRSGESIICLPNKITVTVYSGEEDPVDAVAG